MATVELSEKDIEILKSIIQEDVNDIAEDVSFFEDLKLNPKEFIDDRIELCKKFDLNFWSIVGIYNSYSKLKRLEALYNGETLKHFLENYEEPSQSFLERDFIKKVFLKKKE